MNDLTTPSGVVAHMSAATSESDWSDRIDEVKAANGNQYPSFWFATIVLAGVAGETAAKWGGDDKLHISALN